MKVGWIGLGLALLCLGMTIGATAADEESAEDRIRQLYSTGDREGAVQEIRRAAERGGKWAQTSLGLACLRGDGTVRDIPQAMAWFERAAQQNYPPAQYQLAMLYAQGHGGEENQKSAPELMRRAAEQGYGKARLTLSRWESALHP